jgi:hypothetical protein
VRKNITADTKMIGPELAKKILADHSNYRKPSSTRIEMYARAMKNCEWGTSILIFDEDSELLDGQNRLAAVIKSDTKQQFVILNGWPTNECIYLDNGQARTRSQIAISERGAKNANKAMSIVCSLENPMQNNTGLLNAEAMRLYDKYRHIADAVLDAGHGPLHAAVHLVAFARAILVFPEKEQEILDALAKTTDLLSNVEDRMWGLKLYYQWAIVRGFSRGGQSIRKEAYLRCGRAIMAYLNNEKLTKLYAPKEDPIK